MRLWKSWLLAKKDMKILRRRKSLMVGIVMLPLILGIGLPSLIEFLILRKHLPAVGLSDLLGAFGFFFVIFSIVLPLYISSYSIIGEKLEKSLEPLLSTPTSDEEILVGKYIGVFIPALSAVYLGTVLFMGLVDVFTYDTLGYLFFPNLSYLIVLFIAIPLASIYAISFSVFISGKVNSTQASYQLGALSAVPFFILYVLAEIGIVDLTSNTNILIISGVLLAMAVLAFLVSKATFKREEILTAWK